MFRTLRLPLAAALVPLLLGGCEPAAPTAPDTAAPAPSALLAVSGDADRHAVSGTVWNSCTGEYLAVTGMMTMVLRQHDDAGGGAHRIENYTIHGTAVGLTSGTEYIYHDSHNMRENGDAPMNGWFDDTGAYYFTMSRIVQLVSKGAAPNRTMQHDIWFRVDAAGNVTVQAVRIEVVCGG